MKQTLNYLKLHLPYVLGVVLIVVNYLIDNNYLSVGDKTTGLINAVLAALGLGVLHYRQQKQG